MEIPQAESEKALRGSREAFTEDLKENKSLLTKRIADPGLVFLEKRLGTRTETGCCLAYIKDIAQAELIAGVEQSLEEWKRDEIMDSGVLEQLIKENPGSPFPQCQMTERPDRVCQALLDGRMALLLDHSPQALLLPATLNTLFQTSDDYYRSFWIVSFLRILRAVCAWLAIFLPGFYVAVTCFHTQILPTPLILAMAKARQGVPFPCIVEILLMELAFELIREAGLRMPGAIGNTIGIVGGLIIGQSAVSADLVSPMTVVIVALTALGSFCMPNEEFSEALRMIKYIMLFLGGFFGIFGLVFGGYVLLLHLAELTSCGIPYLYPYVAGEVNENKDLQDALIRAPMTALWKRPLFARRRQRIRMRREGKDVR